MMDTSSKESGKQDMQAMMEVYHKLAIPGAPHELLASMAGSWETRSIYWMEPGKPPAESKGASEQQMILGGRYLQQTYSGDMMGAPFTGVGITGYDNHKQKFVSTWMDSMSTSIFFFESAGEAQDNVITQECNGEDPVRGPMIWRSVTRIVDENTHVFEMYGAPPGGEQEKMMEITYTRK